jgi:hypothetical protein
MCTIAGKIAISMRHSMLIALTALTAMLSTPAEAGSHAAREKLAWMFSVMIACPGHYPDRDILVKFIVRERIDFSMDSPEMLKIRAIGAPQRAKLKTLSKAQACALARKKFGPSGTDIKGLFR